MSDFSPMSFRRPKIAPEALPSDTILVDQTRQRTSWFEGMFVTSQHFNRDQSYAISRQSDFGLAIGAGVIDGLEVSQAEDDPTTLIISAGLGISGGGESIVLHADLRVPLADIALQRSLSQDAALIDTLQLNAESRSGTFVLCATPVEFKSNPEGSYASGPNGQRELRDSVINEATLFTLVPFNLSLQGDDALRQRAVAARRVFLEKVAAGIPPSSLPLAMMELSGNSLRWLDMHLVRRQAGSGRADEYGLGYVDTPTRAAHALQYETMLDQAMADQPGEDFPAFDYFEVLPPMGRLPAATIAARAPVPGQTPVLSQSWLPAEVPVELTALPDDEVAQHLAESLSMPPIDLHASAEELAQTPVTVIIPIPRAEWAEAPLEVQQQALSLKAAKPLGAAPNTPGDLIKALLTQSADDILDEPAEETAWRTLLTGRQTLWYMRRRQFLRTDDLAGAAYNFQTGVSPGDGGSGTGTDGGTDGGTGTDSGTGTDDTDGTVVTPPPPEIDIPGILRPVVEPINVSIRELIARYGLLDIYDSIRTEETEDGFGARAGLDALIVRAASMGSGLALTQIVKGAAKVGDLNRTEMNRLARAIPFDAIARRFVPMEAMIIGGPVRFRFAGFKPTEGVPNINGNTARAINDGLSVNSVELPSVPNAMPSRVEEVLEGLGVPDEIIRATLLSGTGEIPLANPRDIDQRLRLLKFAAEFGTPLVSYLYQEGSVEAQTRRNLLYRTDAIPKLMEALAEVEIARIIDPLASQTKLMDAALTETTSTAIAMAARGVEHLLSGIN